MSFNGVSSLTVSCLGQMQSVVDVVRINRAVVEMHSKYAMYPALKRFKNNCHTGRCQNGSSKKLSFHSGSLKGKVNGHLE